MKLAAILGFAAGTAIVIWSLFVSFADREAEYALDGPNS